MDSTKVLVAANAPGILQRVKDTLAGLEVEVAIRLRDVGGAVRKGGFDLVVIYLGFEEQSTVDLVASLAGGPEACPPAIICIAPGNGISAADALETQMRAAGAVEFIHLSDYPPTTRGNDVLRARILSAASPQKRATPVTRVLQRAARLAGGPAKLALHLEVSEADLARWLSGQEQAPEAVFLAAFEIVLCDLERGQRRPS